MNDCVFCGVVAGIHEGWRVFENDLCIGFLDHAPATRGHTLVMPKAHVSDIWSVDAECLEELARATVEVARLLRTALPLRGLTVMQANGAAA